MTPESMIKLEVLDPKGVSFGGVLYAKGKTFKAPTPKSGLVNALLHFKQVRDLGEAESAEEAEEVKTEDKDPKKK